MNFKWLGPLALLAALVIGDQIRINRPGPQISPDGRGRDARGRQIGLRRDRGPSRPQLQPRRPDPQPTATPCSSISAAARTSSRCWRMSTTSLDLDDINYVALRAYSAGRRQARAFNEMSRLSRRRAGEGALIPVLVTFADPGQSRRRARLVSPDDAEAVLGKGYRLREYHGRSGAERPLAARFRRCAGRARYARNPDEIALAERHRTMRRPRRSGRPACRRDRIDAQRGLHAKIAMQARAEALRILIRRRPRGHDRLQPWPKAEDLAHDNDSGMAAMRRPVVGVIANAHRVENRFQTQMVGERNLRAVADVAGRVAADVRRLALRSPISARCSTSSTA